MLSLSVFFILFFIIFTGDFKFDRIGSPYEAGVPVTAMRAVPAFFGSLLMPAIYNFMLELGVSQYTGALAALLLIFGKFLFV